MRNQNIKYTFNFPQQWCESKALALAFLLIVIFLCFCPGVRGQTIESQKTIEDKESNGAVNAVYIFLNPYEKRDSIAVEDSCLILLRDLPFEINLPLGIVTKTSLPAGTNFFVPKGSYKVENPTNSYVEYQLLSPEICRE